MARMASSITGALTATYRAAGTAGPAERRWLRIAQVRPRDDAPSMADMARLVDEAFSTDPCLPQSDESAAGGKTSPEDPVTGAIEGLPEENEFVEMAGRHLNFNACLLAKKTWIAEVDVFRSHSSPHYEIRSNSARELSRRVIRESAAQHLELNNSTSVDLDMPYHSGISAGSTGTLITADGTMPTITMRGSTINFAPAVSGNLSITYTTQYERVRLEVDNKRDMPGLAGDELPPAAVMVFWGGIAAMVELKPPEIGDTGEDLQQYCTLKVGWSGVGWPEPRCREIVHHRTLCNCSKKEADSYTAEQLVSCPGDMETGVLTYSRSVIDGYVHCTGDEDDVHDPEFYEQKCCTPPPWPLPRCRKTYGLWRGGVGIKHGPQHWFDAYGPGTVLTPITPHDGICGELVTEWEVHAKNCCDDVEPLKESPRNTHEISPGGSLWIEVEDGKPGVPLKWRASGGLYFSRTGTPYIAAGTRRELVIAEQDLCANAVITVDDTCYLLDIQLSGPPYDPPLQIDQDSIVAAQGATVVLSASHYRGELQWAGNGLQLIASAHDWAEFRMPPGGCGTYTPTVSDACGQVSQAVVLSPAGYWKEVLEFDPCSAPWGGSAPARSIDGNHFFVDSYQGWRAVVNWRMSASVGFGQDGCPHLGSCAEAAATIADAPCGYTSTEMIVREDGSSVFACVPRPSAGLNPATYCYPLCRNVYQCFDGPGGLTEPNNQWSAGVFWITQLWRWSCAPEA